MTDPIIPTADQVLTPALNEMYEQRPTSFPFINLRGGVYWHPFLGFRAQAARMLARLVSLVGANHLATATGQDLQDYVSSEFAPLTYTDKTTALGEMVIQRATAITAGDIPAGTRVARAPSATDPVPLTGAQYTTLYNYHFEVGQLTSDPIPVTASAQGSASNHPTVVPAPVLQVAIADAVFDTFTVISFEAAGGSDTADDPYVRRFAKAFARGQYGPTADESTYGAIQATGVRYPLIFDDATTGTENILVADISWASSSTWASTVQQSMVDNDLIGFGCQVAVGSITNQIIVAYPSITLRDPAYLANTSDVTEAARQAVKSYFDDRPDFNCWNKAALMGAITRCHPKILVCTAVDVKDPSGTPIAEILTPDYTQQQTHFYLAQNAIKPTYALSS